METPAAESVPGQVVIGFKEGVSYTFDDKNTTSGLTYYYKLEKVDVRGDSRLRGPVQATAGTFNRSYLPMVMQH
jgi:hypothetical protein